MSRKVMQMALDAHGGMTNRDCGNCGTKGCGHDDARRCGVHYSDWTEKESSLMERLINEAEIGKQHRVSVADALEFRRDQYVLTQSAFAKILGLQKSHYSEIIHGKRSLPIKAARRAFAVGVPADVLLQTEMD